MANLTKNLRKYFSRKNLLPKTDGSRPTSMVADHIFRQDMKLLERFHACYDSLDQFREKRYEYKDNYFGHQLGRLIYDPDSCKSITEEEYMRKQGITPMSINIINKAAVAITGVYCTSNFAPLAIARDRDEQKLGEMMSATMEYVYQNLNLPEKNTRGFEEFLISALVPWRVCWDINEKRQCSDVKVELLDPNRMAFDANTSGQYFENITCIGYLHDMTIGNILSKWAHSQSEKEQIKRIYNCEDTDYISGQQQFTKDTRRKSISFYETLQPYDHRVYEIWTKEQFDSLYCHDTAKGEQYFVDVAEEENIVAENNRRIVDFVNNGGYAEDAALIEYEYKVEEKWVVRYLTPNGYVLNQEITPYLHGSHPFVVGAYPLVDGEIHSFVEKAINVQRMVNRLLMRIEYLRMNDAKGLYMVKKKILDDSGLSLPQFAAKVTSPNAVVALDWEGNENPVIQLHGQSNSQGDVQMLGQYMTLLDEITGAHGAMRGERPTSGTPASLYAQETENANNNIADMLQWYNGLIRERDYKIMQVVQQYYTDRRHLSVVGKAYSDEVKWYDPDKVRNSQFDLALVENQSTGIFRAANENLLITLLQNGQIDVKTYLESSTAPFADKMLERIKQRENEMQEQQQQQQQQQQLQQQQAAQAAAQQAMPPEAAQVPADIA